MDYTVQERVQLIKWYYGGNSVAGTRDLFAAMFPERPVPSRSTIQRTIMNFESCGSVSKRKNVQGGDNGEPADLELLICAAVENNNSLSSRQIADMFGVSHTNVQKLLHKNNYRAFKVSTSQILLEDDYFRRLEFCENMLNRIHQYPEFLSNVLFCDESTFHLNRSHNKSIVRYWSRKNLRVNIPTRTQFQQKLNVWTGVIGDVIIGPFFINGNLNSRKYLTLLREQIIPAIGRQGIDIESVWLLHDGCPAHGTNEVTNYLNAIFPNRIIGNRGTIRWPPRSPDLTLLDFFLWPYLKNQIYGHRHIRCENLDELRHRIIELCADINPNTLTKVRQNFYDRLSYCTAEQGGLFEHLI